MLCCWYSPELPYRTRPVVNSYFTDRETEARRGEVVCANHTAGGKQKQDLNPDFSEGKGAQRKAERPAVCLLFSASCTKQGAGPGYVLSKS
jgi:hypothetical protein